MNKLVARWLCGLAIFFTLCGVLQVQSYSVFAATESRAECVIEQSSRRVLYQKNAEERLPMASTTKILTAIIILEDCKLDEIVTVPKQAELAGGSSVYLREGDTLSIKDLLYGLMLRSGNDCAVTLAMHHSGSCDAFAQVMNERAVRMGAEHSHFTNPNGMPDEYHNTTASDLAFISAYAMENETFREIVSCKFYEARGWKNKNKMLYEYDGAIGIKTGFTMRAGRCLVTAAVRNGMTLICVVINSPQMYERTTELIDDSYGRYTLVKLCDKNERIEGYEIRHDFYYPLEESEQSEISIQVETLDEPSKHKGDFVGQMKIYLKNDLLFSQNLYIV